MSICSRVSILQDVKVSIFPIGNWRRRYNSAALHRCSFRTAVLTYDSISEECLINTLLHTVLQEKYLGVLLSHYMSHTYYSNEKLTRSLVFSITTWQEVHLTVRNLLMLLCCFPHLSMLASYGIHTFRRTWTVLNEFSERLPVGSLLPMTGSLVSHISWENYNGKHCRSVTEFNVWHLCRRFSMVRWQCQLNWLTWYLLSVCISWGDHNQRKLYKPRTHTTEYRATFYM